LRGDVGHGVRGGERCEHVVAVEPEDFGHTVFGIGHCHAGLVVLRHHAGPDGLSQSFVAHNVGHTLQHGLARVAPGEALNAEEAVLRP